MSDQTLQEILSVVKETNQKVDALIVDVEFVKENAITRDSFEEKLTEVKSEILGDVDGFIKLHETLDQELSALRSKYSRLEERLTIVEQKLQTA